jgi:hypothetical protein
MITQKFTRRIGGILGTLRAEYFQIYNRYFENYEHFDGDAREISQQVLDRLWDEDFYRTSLGHFDFFWMRDFGTVAESLTNLGNKEKVHHTLSWALFHFHRAGEVTLCIDKAGNTFNAPAKKSVDALPWLLHSIVVSGYPLDNMERKFLERELRRYCKRLLDAKTGDLRSTHYAELRDAVNYDRSAYAITLIGRMAKCVDELKLNGFPYPESHYRDLLLNHYWNGTYFMADHVTNVWSSECGLMPFFLGLIDDEAKVNKTMDYINKVKLNKPYPLVYCQHPDVFHYRLGMGKILMPNYTGTSIWTWHGTFYLHLLKRYKRPEYKEQYDKFSELIERHGTYPEMVGPNGEWYKTPIYNGDPGMVWAALFLELPQTIK